MSESRWRLGLGEENVERKEVAAYLVLPWRDPPFLLQNGAENLVAATNPSRAILCLDLDPEVLQILREALADTPYEALRFDPAAPPGAGEPAERGETTGEVGEDAGAGRGQAGLDVAATVTTLRGLRPAAIVLPVIGSGLPQLDLLRALRQEGIEIPVLVLAERGSMAVTIAATQAGAYDFLTKPLDPAKLGDALKRALATPGATARPLSTEPLPDDELTIVGESEGIVGIYKTIGRVADSNATVLIVGESGTGKELVARVIHRASARAAGPFLAINCAAIPENLLESELFGHEKGAFTGAVGRRIGKFERAERGTLFLDEIGDMSLALQAKILRVLQEREIERVGGKEKLNVDVRVMAATNRDLAQDVSTGRFREDLFFRLAVVTLELPPLRARRGDIPLLIDFFTRRFAGEGRSPVTAVAGSVYALLEDHRWPGNIRQLRNALERAVIMCQGRTLLPDHFSPDLFREAPAAALPSPGARLLPLEEVEKHHIRTVLEATDWNMSRAAEILGIHRNTLRRRARELGVGRVA